MKGIGTLHMHKRAGGGRHLLPRLPHRLSIRLLDRAAILAGIIGPIMTMPQIWQIYYHQNAAGVSALSWGSYAALNIIFILYGFVHRNTLIKVTYLCWIAVNTAVAVGAVIYG